ncbi:metallophosphoesterase [Conexibacter sp. CPCC 206217]|uniref:metallophosphoesterase n=1 Tax=Conexibacter sp. CPCC 206217 TaxID=3064574 RepID=UPI002720CAD7|nr:metallophosphoesterase [Conexibacter sp. CPCC 206217]MDO8213493.1 hypothetical protein [Conexibacter sp. CPCC 206217]
MVSAAIDVVVVCALVAWMVRFRPSPLGLLAGVGLVAGVLGVKLAAMVALGLDRQFGVLHVLWLDAVVVVPLAAVLLALLGWSGGGWALRALVVLGLLMAPVGVYASFVEPNRLVVERTPVPLSPARAGTAPVDVAVLADIQFEHVGEHEREAVARVMALRPDVILLPGDYQQGSPAVFERELPAIRALFARLHAPGGVFAVEGDQEQTMARTRRIFAGTDVRVLDNEIATTRVGDRRFTVGGVEQWDGSARAVAVAQALDDRPGTDDVRLLLVHHPTPILRAAPNRRVDLIVAGHTHGGQLQLPFIGPLTTASPVPREIAAGGLHTLDGRRIYVSRGVGVERGAAPKLRLGAPPEISLLTLD